MLAQSVFHWRVLELVVRCMGTGCYAEWFLMVVSSWDPIELPWKLLPKSHVHLSYFLLGINFKPCVCPPFSAWLLPSAFLHLPLCQELLSTLKGSCYLMLAIAVLYNAAHLQLSITNQESAIVNRSRVVRLITSTTITASAALCLQAVPCIFLDNYWHERWNSNKVSHGSKSKPSALSVSRMD